MGIKDGWLVVAGIIIFIAALFLGFDLGRTATIDDCTNFGSFIHEGKHFRCSPVTQPDSGGQ